jgi:hypothetical protein
LRRSFKLALKPFSVNAMYAGRRDFKTSACQDWERLFLYELGKSEPQKALQDLREHFVLHQHVYRMRIVWKVPRVSFITQKGEISNRSFDVTNVEKIITDLVFLPKYHVQRPPHGCLNLNADDKHLLTLTSGKRCSSEDKYEIQITLWVEDIKKYV